ncbi:MAG TPA: hypothetical protein PKI20_14505 [Verrucomicrobiota bacterium]|nr:hypothetical protein [Verrucomicrobiota bacterium]HQL79155.1 hypothetical protein [Verrucomicrobiota bacterium]
MTRSRDKLRFFAELSVNCPVCRRARRQQAGLAFRLVKTFENLCPFCRAYEEVYGRKSHEPLPPSQSRESERPREP